MWYLAATRAASPSKMVTKGVSPRCPRFHCVCYLRGVICPTKTAPLPRRSTCGLIPLLPLPSWPARSCCLGLRLLSGWLVLGSKKVPAPKTHAHHYLGNLGEPKARKDDVLAAKRRLLLHVSGPLKISPSLRRSTPALTVGHTEEGMRCEQPVTFVITKHEAARYEGKPKQKRCRDRDDEGRLYLCNRHELERLSRIRRFGKPRG